MSAPDPMTKTYPTQPAPVSTQTFIIAGILTTVYGLSELPPTATTLSCLWLLHPRLQEQACMAPIAANAVHAWQASPLSRHHGLIAVSFDQRNHGSRQVDAVANEAWRTGNKRHAQDMFSSYHGTALDCSQLMTYLPAYTFPKSERAVTNHVCLGISLGGHAAWHCILQEPRMKTAVVVIGCPDYASLMSDRATLSRLKTAGRGFIGSEDFPPALVEAVEMYDPAGLLLGNVTGRTAESYTVEASEAAQRRLAPLLRERLQAKRIITLSGGADKLVPYARGKPFMDWFKKVIGPEGVFYDGGVVLEDIVFDGVGHEMSPGMVTEAIRFINEALEAEIGGAKKTSKI